LDLAFEIPAHFGEIFAGDGRPLSDIAAEPEDLDRLILSQYHAAGAVSGAFMLRSRRWKPNRYINFPSELFDLENDPEELEDLAGRPDYARHLAALETELETHLDPVAVDALAFSDQAEMIEGYGGRDDVLKLGVPVATTPPTLP